MGKDNHTEEITEANIYGALSECYDPEIPIDIVSLGLVYGITIVDDWVGVKMTLTSPGCPASNAISQQVKERLKHVPGVSDADVRIVWQPPWDPGKMSDDAKKRLGVKQ